MRIDYEEGFIETIFYDGTICQGHWDQGSLEANAAYAKTARKTGYGDDLRRMAIENDLLHSFVSTRAGMPFSPALWGTAHKRWWPGWADEENWVYALQCLLHDGWLSEGHRAAIQNYVYWLRPRTTLEELVTEAREWLEKKMGEHG